LRSERNSNGAVGSCESDGEAADEEGSWRGEPAAMRGGGVRQSGRAVATKELEVARKVVIVHLAAELAVAAKPSRGRSEAALAST
jgi:hypothetical protein